MSWVRVGRGGVFFAAPSTLCPGGRVGWVNTDGWAVWHTSSVEEGIVLYYGEPAGGKRLSPVCVSVEGSEESVGNITMCVKPPVQTVRITDVVINVAASLSVEINDGNTLLLCPLVHCGTSFIATWLCITIGFSPMAAGCDSDNGDIGSHHCNGVAHPFQVLDCEMGRKCLPWQIGG